MSLGANSDDSDNAEAPSNKSNQLGVEGGKGIKVAFAIPLVLYLNLTRPFKKQHKYVANGIKSLIMRTQIVMNQK